MSNETEDPSGDADTDDVAATGDTTDVDSPAAEGPDDGPDGTGGLEGPDRADDGGPGDDEPDWEYVLAQISRDTATTKRLAAVVLVVVVVASVVLGVLIRNTDNSSTKSASATPSTASTTTTPALESVAGQPCVALADPLPAGAPPMDIDVGPAPTTLVIKDIKEGTGAAATATSTATVNYVGVACSTGKIFDSSYKGGTATPVSIPLNQVIPGFAQGVTGMKVGGQRLIGIPSDLAYGSQGGGATIAPDESLWFVVELTAVTP